MQLERVKISNVLSFPYVDTLADEPGVNFHSGQAGIMNILIGPNGSGKSNFLEIINQIFKVGLIKDFVYDRSQVQNDKKKTIISQDLSTVNIAPHLLTPNKPSHVMMTLILNQNDLHNMQFVIRYRDILNDIIARYSSLDITFPPIPYEDLIFVTNLDLYFHLDIGKGTIAIDTSTLHPAQLFILQYIQYRELIQICMNIYNDYERKPTDRKWYPLKNTFAILGSDRTENIALISDIDPQEKSVLIASQTTKSNTTIGYTLCMSKIVHIISEARNGDAITQDLIDTTLAYHPFVQGLQGLLSTYLGLQMLVTLVGDKYQVSFVDKDNHHYSFSMLSSGELSFIMILFALHGYDLENGLMIIDEPELHLHPQMQKRFMDMTREVSDTLKMQFIVATHSPTMINEQNIGHVYKFAKRNLSTVIYNPAHRTIAYDEANLIHMLKFGNVSKMFFVDKIIMVEGETDAYFFDYYLQHLRTVVPWADKIQNYEIININGKGGYRKWSKFLQKFGLQTSFIGDWDNVIDTGIIDDINLVHRAQNARHKFRKSKMNRYGGTVAAIRKYYPHDYDYIMEEINAMYEKNIFILKKGDLETYLNLPEKGLDETITFCRTGFTNWLQDPLTQEHRNELYQIFSAIFHDTTFES